MICFEHASKFVLSDVSIHIPEGTTVGLIGASGAGKTTFLKLACGLLLPEQGFVRTVRKDPVTCRNKLGVSMGAMLNDIPVLAYFPAQFLLRKDDMAAYPELFMYLTPAVGIVLYLLAYAFWRFSIRYYKSSGN